ncbi:hypothetical protein HK097_006068, partial [Rhizophlyctis rosea]
RGGDRNDLQPDEPIDIVQLHVNLCKQVLELIRVAVRKLGPEFSEDTWIVLLKVILGVTDCLLREPMERERSGWGEGKHQRVYMEGDDPGPRMADLLCEDLIWVLVELWLRSCNYRVEMWDYLK